MNQEFSPDDRLLTMGEVRERVPFSKVHIYRLIDRGDFPRQIRLTERRVAWIESEIHAWISERLARRQGG